MNPPSVQARLTSVDYDPFAGGALSRVAPTTEPQREVWLADKLSAEASLSYNESVLAAPARRARYRRAQRRPAARHRSPRCAARDVRSRWRDVLRRRAASDCSCSRSTCPRSTTEARDAEVATRKRLAVETPFELERGPLFRAELLRLAENDHLLILTAHHIVCDGWSWWLMMRELATFYASAAGHERADLPEPVSFADYALEQATQSGGAVYADDERYWLSRFDGEVPVLDLPLDRARPARRTFASLREDHVLDAALVADIKRLGARRGASLFATLLGGFATVLSRLSGQPQVVIGIPAAGQSVDGLDTLVGHCVNLLPLRFDVDPAQPFATLIDTSQETLLDAIDHQRYTFGTLLKKLRVDRDPSRLPLVSVMFTIDQAIDGDSHGFPGLATDFATNARTFENFELFVNAVQLEGGLQLECQYNTDLFDAATIRRWMQGYELLLRSAVQRSEAALGSLPMVDGDAMQALVALQPAPTPYGTDVGMHELFELQCDRTPERIALRYKDQALTYAQLDARANRIASLLRARGVHRGALVGLALDRGVDMLAALLGILKTGAGYVPLDPAFPEERLTYMVGDASLAALVTQRSHADRFDLRGRPVLALDTMADELAQASDARPPREAVDPESIAYVIYTSGSTGKPKGVQVPHRGVSNFITAMQARPGIQADDKLVAVTTLSFDIAVLELMLPLSVGGEVILADRETAMDGELLSALLRDRGATLMQATPATWRVLIDAGWRGSDSFSVLCGGEPLPPDLARALLARSGAVWNLYGPTETTVWSTCWRVEAPEKGISIGTPIANNTRLGARSAMPAMPARRARRTVHRRRRRDARLPRSRRSHFRPLHHGRLQQRRRLQARREALSHRRSRPLARGRYARTSRPPRLPGQGARLSHRARRDRSGAGQLRRRRAGGSAGARGSSRRRAHRRLRRRTAGRQARRTHGARPAQGRVARIHGPAAPGGARCGAAAAERKNRPQVAARARPRRPQRRTGAAAQRPRARDRHVDVASARHARDRHPRQLLLARRPLAARRAADLAPESRTGPVADAARAVRRTDGRQARRDRLRRRAGCAAAGDRAPGRPVERAAVADAGAAVDARAVHARAGDLQHAVRTPPARAARSRQVRARFRCACAAPGRHAHVDRRARRRSVPGDPRHRRQRPAAGGRPDRYRRRPARGQGARGHAQAYPDAVRSLPGAACSWRVCTS